MNSKLVDQALKIIPSREILITLVGQRVSELASSKAKGKDPEDEFLPAGREIDFVLQEIINGKITYESASDVNS
jgi:hypothetical protein